MKDMDNRHMMTQHPDRIDPQRDGSLDQEYQMYLVFTDDEHPKTYEEWLES